MIETTALQLYAMRVVVELANSVSQQHLAKAVSMHYRPGVGGEWLPFISIGDGISGLCLEERRGMGSSQHARMRSVRITL